MSGNNFSPPDIQLTVPDSAREQLNEYLDMLMSWNRALNLVGSHSREKIITDLVGDSFHLACFLDKLLANLARPYVADLGAGAGLPGIPLRMVWQKGVYEMVEIREKRALFLANALSRLNLPRTYVFRGSAEKFFAAGKNVDCVVSRAFKPWPELLKMCSPCIGPGACVVIMANRPLPDAIEGWNILDQYSYAAMEKSRWFWALAPEHK